MKIYSENVSTSKVKLLEGLVDKAIEGLKNFGKTCIDTVKNDFIPLLDDLMKQISGEMQGIAFGKEVEELDLKTLISFAQQYIVKNSNEIVALKTLQDESYFIYMAFSKDRKLMSKEKNKYLIVKAKSLSKEVSDLFSESDLIIIK